MAINYLTFITLLSIAQIALRMQRFNKFTLEIRLYRYLPLKVIKVFQIFD